MGCRECSVGEGARTLPCIRRDRGHTSALPARAQSAAVPTGREGRGVDRQRAVDPSALRGQRGQRAEGSGGRTHEVVHEQAVAGLDPEPPRHILASLLRGGPRAHHLCVPLRLRAAIRAGARPKARRPWAMRRRVPPGTLTPGGGWASATGAIGPSHRSVALEVVLPLTEMTSRVPRASTSHALLGSLPKSSMMRCISTMKFSPPL